MGWTDLLAKQGRRDALRQKLGHKPAGSRKRRKNLAYAQRALVVERARANRAQPTELEALVWSRVRGSQLGFRVRREAQIGGRYIADFLIPAVKIILELDGGVHHRLGQERYDARRDLWLAERGYIVLRISNENAKDELDRLLSELTTFAERLAPAL